jgi:dienelactone hydrolase
MRRLLQLTHRIARSITPVMSSKPYPTRQYEGLAHPPHISRLEHASGRKATVEAINIDVQDGVDGFVPGFLHLPPDFTAPPPAQHHHRTAAILLSGAGGGVTGPSSIYLSLACKLATLGTGIPALRLDYRMPARNKACVKDVKAGMKYLQDMYGLDRFVLVGWSFGGAPVFTVGGEDQRVVGCATVASQTAETEGIRRLAPRPVLLLHGTGDSTLSPWCSQRLYDMYGNKGDRKLELFEDDNHALSRNAGRAEAMLCEFIARCAGLTIDGKERENVVSQELVDDTERIDLMKKGGDLREPESAQ